MASSQPLRAAPSQGRTSCQNQTRHFFYQACLPARILFGGDFFKKKSQEKRWQEAARSWLAARGSKALEGGRLRLPVQRKTATPRGPAPTAAVKKTTLPAQQRRLFHDKASCGGEAGNSPGPVRLSTLQEGAGAPRGELPFGAGPWAPSGWLAGKASLGSLMPDSGQGSSNNCTL